MSQQENAPTRRDGFRTKWGFILACIGSAVGIALTPALHLQPLLVAGVGTHTLEILEAQPDVDVIIVPIGGGSGAAGASLVAKSVNPLITVIGVGAAGAPAAFLTWQTRAFRSAPIDTFAGGLATGEPFMLPQRILWQYLDDFTLVGDDEMRVAVRLLLEKAKTLAEPAGAAPLAAALRLREDVRGKKIALILSGGNISPDELRQCLDASIPTF